MIRSLVRIAVVAALVAVASSAPAQLLLIEHDVTVGGMVSDRFTWRDAADQPRVAVLAHNDGQAGPGGTRGGELREFQYQIPGGITRIVRAAPTSGASGFGYVVAHRSEGTNGIAEDDSPFGHFFPGQFQRVFEGRYHAIFRFTQLYPRHSKTDAMPPNTRYDVPVTVDWVFATGRNHPLWAITWDLSGVPVNAVESDSRAPYGELLFDGSASEVAHSMIAGVGWGDRFKFVSTTNPVTYNSPWTWNTPNTNPYVKLWTTAVDATMGTVLTQTIVQQDAGGYFGTNRWNTTSAAGNACNVGGENHVMPCSFNWPYQSINFSFGSAIGGNDNDVTNNTRLAWGTNFGFLGQAQYPIHGSDFFGGPLPGNPTASGYPKKSYSTFIVLGLHNPDPVDAQVAQNETVQNTILTANVGSVVTAGPAGVNRTDPVPYAPAGWNHVYAAWALQAAGNHVNANFDVGAGTLTNPLVIVSGWTAGLPSAVWLNGVLLARDVDYFPSPRPGADELWITLNRGLAGPANWLEILAGPVVTRIVTGAGEGAGSHVRGFTETGAASNVSFLVYPAGFFGGVRVATGDVDGDGAAELITAAGPGGGPHIRVFAGPTASTVVTEFFAYDPGFTNGLFVAAGDVDGDGKAEIITGAGPGGGPNIRVFKVNPGGPPTVIRDFFAYDPGFRGGITVASCDIDGDGFADIVSGSGPGGGPHVQVFSGKTGAVIRSFFAYDPGFTGGVYVACGDVDGDGVPDIITGVGPGGGPHVQVFSGKTGAVIASFFAYDPGARVGMRVAAADLDGDGRAEIITAPGPGGGPHVKAFRRNANGSMTEVASFFAYDPAFLGGVFIAGMP